MSDAQLIKPDLGYVKEIMNAGGESLKKCYQCATCSVVCEIAPDGKPFPRKEMIWAQWGQKKKLVNNPDVWLCHQCSDCTAKCPRDAKPGEVLGAVRRTAYTHFAWPGFMGKIFSGASGGNLAVLFGIPVVILLAVIAIFGSFSPPRGDAGQIIFSKFIGEFHFLFEKPISAIDLIFVPIAALVVFSAFVSLNEFWKGMDSQVDPSVPRKSFGSAAGELVRELISHATFKKCVSSAGRSTAHQLVLFGFVGLFITTGFAAMFEWGHILLGWHTTSPLPVFGYGFVPKVIGTVSGAALVTGWFLMRKNRSENAENNPMSSYDSIFLWVIGLVGITGFASWIFRLTNIGILAYPTYFIHLVFVFYVIAYLPFSKLAHLLYRSTAIIHAKTVGRDALAVVAAAPAPVAEAPAPEAEAEKPAAEGAEEVKKEEPEA
jgi:quinone-modifying oxidoreductase subunit QmoC